MSRGPGPTGGATAATPIATGFITPGSEPAQVSLPRHLYVHVPLCRSKCTYCDFFSRADDGSVSHAELTASTLDLLESWLTSDIRPVPLETLYIGGGTPTLLGVHLADLVSGIVETVPLQPGAEVTAEANPESLSRPLVQALVAAGVTRVSIGVQSLDDAALRLLGRCHDGGTALAAIRTALAAELDVSADLMCGIPGVTSEAWAASLSGVIATGVTHVSVYPLSVESGTRLADAIAEGRVLPPDEDATVDAMEVASEMLSAHGLRRYEVANYARPGHESRHNTAYWTGRPYLGIGGGAHGMLDGDQARATGLIPAGETATARVRYAYVADAFPARSASPLAFVEALAAGDALHEDAMLGMRMTEGIAEELAARAAVLEPLESLAADGLVVHDGGRWRPTQRGWLFGNEVFGRIWGAGE